MDIDLSRLLHEQGGVATSGQILDRITRHAFDRLVHDGSLARIWQGIYCLGEPTEALRLRGLDLTSGTTVAVCLGTAAAWYGFDTEDTAALHVVNPPSHQLRPAEGLVVHRRDGAPLRIINGRPATTPTWTAVEVARSLRRPRALATLDAALRSETCTRTELWRAAIEQAGRRGIVAVRDLLSLADARAESPMESELRLVVLDGGLPAPELQHQVRDRDGRLWRLDLAWPDQHVAAEYDGMEWHEGADALRRDRIRQEALRDIGWTVLRVVYDDVRHRPFDIVGRIGRELAHARAV
jgi:very-short-patch-repair endonuclease